MNQNEVKQYLITKCHELGLELDDKNIKILFDIFLKGNHEHKHYEFLNIIELKEPYIGDLFTLLNFIKDCNDGYLIDDDGIGYISIKINNKMYEISMDAMDFSNDILSIYNIEALSESLLQIELKINIDEFINEKFGNNDYQLFVMWYNK